MQYYYSSKKPNALGIVKVHAENCKDLPDVLGRIYLGIFPNGNLALASVREKFQLTNAKICSCCVDQNVFSEN
ncbi:hypothetical protein ML462_01660 [Gramella lutea]|uniref:Uncharacterized protein n=1 Tax=Christiangramia lutea TaxID=1607951 RepID=A0A9X1V0R4_9FLAO|nr:hypothetical protein [Christiangramia lutea]MCH4821866.1 hypothetical protein [Christiangramia lutea]